MNYQEAMKKPDVKLKTLYKYKSNCTNPIFAGFMLCFDFNGTQYTGMKITNMQAYSSKLPIDNDKLCIYTHLTQKWISNNAKCEFIPPDIIKVLKRFKTLFSDEKAQFLYDNNFLNITDKKLYEITLR